MRALRVDMSRQQLQEVLGLKDAEHFRKAHLQPAPEAGLIEMTEPDKPRSSRQRYRRTPKGSGLAGDSSSSPRTEAP